MKYKDGTVDAEGDNPFISMRARGHTPTITFITTWIYLHQLNLNTMALLGKSISCYGQTRTTFSPHASTKQGI